MCEALFAINNVETIVDFTGDMLLVNARLTEPGHTNQLGAAAKQKSQAPLRYPALFYPGKYPDCFVTRPISSPHNLSDCLNWSCPGGMTIFAHPRPISARS